MVADVGCGHGHSTVLMAKAFPKSRFWGFDVHEESIATARKVAHAAGVEDRVSFEVAKADTYSKRGYDLVPSAATISSASSIACTTWAGLSMQRGTRQVPWPRMAPSC